LCKFSQEEIAQKIREIFDIDKGSNDDKTKVIKLTESLLKSIQDILSPPPKEEPPKEEPPKVQEQPQKEVKPVASTQAPLA
jgi:hypothetical protein